MNTTFSKVSLITAAVAAFSFAQPSWAQSEASLDTAVSGVSEGSAQILGSIIGVGAGLSIGAVIVSGTAASVTLDAGADASGTALSITLELPIEIARRLQRRRGESVETEQTSAGTLLRSRGELIAFVPNAASQNQARREL